MGRPPADETRGPYCFRIRPSIAKRLDVFCHDRVLGKGLIVERALEEFLDRAERAERRRR